MSALPFLRLAVNVFFGDLSLCISFFEDFQGRRARSSPGLRLNEARMLKWSDGEGILFTAQAPLKVFEKSFPRLSGEARELPEGHRDSPWIFEKHRQPDMIREG